VWCGVEPVQQLRLLAIEHYEGTSSYLQHIRHEVVLELKPELTIPDFTSTAIPLVNSMRFGDTNTSLPPFWFRLTALSSCCCVQCGMSPPTNTLTECFQELPYELYVRQPLRASRLVEAAVRTTPKELSTDEVVYLLTSILIASDTTSPEGAASSTNLLLNKRLTTRSCSQLVSTLKAISQPPRPQIDQQRVITAQIRVASSVAFAGLAVHSWAIGEQCQGGVVCAAGHQVALGGKCARHQWQCRHHMLLQ
jgi:hypothetical protein